MLESAAQLVKRKGVLVYSTCSILDEENKEIVADFLKNHSDFHIDHASQYVHSDLVTEEGYIQTWPDLHQIDGSFSARFIRKRCFRTNIKDLLRAEIYQIAAS